MTAGAIRAALLTPVAQWRAAVRRRRRAGRPQGGARALPVIGLASAGPGLADRAAVAGLVVQVLAAQGLAAHLGALTAGPSAQVRRAEGRLGPELAALSVVAPLWLGAPDRLDAMAAAARAGGAQALVLRLPEGADRLGCDRVVLALGSVGGLAGLKAWPSGPLADPPGDLLAAADVLLVTGEAGAEPAFAWHHGAHATAMPRLQAASVVLDTGMDWLGMTVLVAATSAVLGRATGELRARGARVAGARILEPDLPPGAPLLRRLLHEAQAAGARLVMADGEAACLPRDARRQVLALPVRLVLAPGQTGTAIWPGQ